MIGLWRSSLSGRLLAATPQLGDPNFRRTVVLIVEDDKEEGTLGVVLNRPTEVPLDQVLEPWTALATGPPGGFPRRPDLAEQRASACPRLRQRGARRLALARRLADDVQDRAG